MVDCHVWIADRPASIEELSSLNSIELRRSETITDGIARIGFLTSAALLRTAAGYYLQVAPDSLLIDRTCVSCGEPHGAPVLPDTGVYVSTTRSSGFVAVALCGTSVGIDAEKATSADMLNSIQPYWLGSSERLRRSTDAPLLWSCKESVLKMLGVGLDISPSDVVIDWVRGSEPHISVKGVAIGGTILCFRLFSLATLSVAIETKNEVVMHWHYLSDF